MLTQLANLTLSFSKITHFCGLSAHFCFVLSLVSLPAPHHSDTTLTCKAAAVCLGNRSQHLLAELLLILFPGHLFSINLLMISCYILLFHLCSPLRACIHTHLISWRGHIPLYPTALLGSGSSFLYQDAHSISNSFLLLLVYNSEGEML